MTDLPDGFEVKNDLPQGFEIVAPQAKAGEQVYGRLPFQAAAGAIEALGATPGVTPNALKWLGSQVSRLTGLPEPAPIQNAPPTPDQQLSSVLPPPQNEGEDIARNIGGSALGGLFAKGHLAENLLGGIGAGLGAHYGPQIASSYGIMTPNEGAIAGALVGGFAGAHGAGNVANAITRGGMPKPQEILSATSNAYDALRMDHRAISVPPTAVNIIRDSALSMLKSAGPAEKDAESVYGIIKGLDTNNTTAADLLNARRNLRSQFSGGPNPNKPAAAMTLQVMDAALEKILPPDTMATLKKLDQNWSAARAAQAVDAKISQAESGAEAVNSGMNTGNKILQKINSFINSRTDQTGKVHMDPQDLAALQSVKPSAMQSAQRFLGSASGGMGGLTLAGLAGGLGAQGINKLGASATEQADPLIGSIAMPLLGLASRYGFNRSVLRAAKNAEAAILARAPYMQGVSIPRQLLSGPQVAGRSLLFAAPAIRDEFNQGTQ